MSGLSGLLSTLSGFSRGVVRRTRVAEVGRTLRLARNGEVGPDCSRLSAYIYLALFVPAIASVVLSNWKWNALVNDTLLLISSFDALERFSSLFSNANANPLQALFDIFPSGLRLDTIPNIIGRAAFGPGMHVDFFYAFCAVLLAYAAAAMARTVGLRWGVAVLAGILLPLLVLPILGIFPLVEHFYILWPITYYSTAGTVLVTALFWRIDGRSWRRSAVLTVAIILVLLHLSMIEILFMTLLAPVMVAMGAGALAASRSRDELLAKIIAAIVVVAALAGAGILHYLYAIGVNSASYVFYQELMDFMNFAGPSWSVILDDIGMVIINPFTYSIKGTATIDGILVPLSQLGAIHLAISGKTRDARIFGRTVLAWVVATAFVIAILHNFYYYTGTMYQGPDPRHFIPILWPYYAICLASLIFAVVELCVSLLSRAWPAAHSILNYVPHGLVILVLAGPVAFIATNRILGAAGSNLTLGTAFFETSLPFFHSFRSNPIVDYLEPEVGVAIDRDFRGSVVSMPTDYNKDTKPYAAWRREATFAWTRAYLAYDFAFGLRYYNIPTLDEETHNITPQFYLTVRELLSRPGTDAYDKHYAMVTRLNEPIMALLGLRYIIADYELPFGAQRLAMPIPEEARKVLEKEHLYKSPVRVYELPDPNLGNYSPTKIVLAKTAKATIVAMSSPAFDGRQTVLTDDASIADNLVPATGAKMTVRMGGVALRASSAGQSVLVLPVQYSHCWQIVSGSGATLFRANLTQLGVRFSGELQVELRQVFGPFWQSACRQTDAADVERLRMADALGAGAELRKIPGDGINMIASPEALGKAIGNSAIASIKSPVMPNVPIREFTITAQGKWGEHYTVLNLPALSPGPYTLSMQVRASSTTGLALQLKDVRDNGLFADYLLPTRNVWLTRLRQGDKLNATIEKIDDEWVQLTLTSTLTTDTGAVFIHVKDKHGRRNFEPNGEAVTIRAVKLEHGETATPYSPPDQHGVHATNAGQAKIPGDGVNIIPSPEALETAVGSSEIATFTPVATPGAPVRQYKLTAIGKPTEHFIAISDLPVSSGTHMLAMQIKPAGAARMRLQLLDDRNNGAIADYDLAEQTVSLSNLAKSDKMDGGIRKVGKDWLELTLTSTMETGISRVIIQLMGADGSNGFAPNGEAVVLRGVKLERGETATPYPGLGP
jgi:hypothetical protein